MVGVGVGVAVVVVVAVVVAVVVVVVVVVVVAVAVAVAVGVAVGVGVSTSRAVLRHIFGVTITKGPVVTMESVQSILDGRAVMPTVEEFDAHESVGKWRIMLPNERVCVVDPHTSSFALMCAAVRWWAIDARENNCAWPVVAGVNGDAASDAARNSSVMRFRCSSAAPAQRGHLHMLVRLPVSVGMLSRLTDAACKCDCGADVVLAKPRECDVIDEGW